MESGEGRVLEGVSRPSCQPGCGRSPNRATRRDRRFSLESRSLSSWEDSPVPNFGMLSSTHPSPLATHHSPLATHHSPSRLPHLQAIVDGVPFQELALGLHPIARLQRVELFVPRFGQLHGDFAVAAEELAGDVRPLRKRESGM